MTEAVCISPKKRPKRAISASSTHLYLIGNLFYFRYRFPQKLRKLLGYTEIRISLGTGRRRHARNLSSRLYLFLLDILGIEPMLDYDELRRRLYIFIQNDVRNPSTGGSWSAYTYVKKPQIETLYSGEDLIKYNEIMRQINEHRSADNENLLQPRNGQSFTDAAYAYYSSSHKNEKSTDTEKEEHAKKTKEFACAIIKFLELQNVAGENEFKCESDEDAAIVISAYEYAGYLWNYYKQHDYMPSDDIWFSRIKPLANISSKQLQKTLTYQFPPTISPTSWQYRDLKDRQYLSTKPGPTSELAKAFMQYDFGPLHIDPKPPKESPHRNTPTMYSEIVELYINRQIGEGRWKPTTLDDHKHRVKCLIKIIGDKPIKDIGREDLIGFREKLKLLPPGWSKKAQFKGKPINDIISENSGQSLAIKTVNEILGATSSFFKWCVDEDILTKNVANNLKLKDDRLAVEQRDLFSKDELLLIFSHDNFTKGDFKKPAYFWIPIIALYTGMRLEEIAQLFVSDIYQDKDDIWVIDINAINPNFKTGEKGKTIKSKNAKRVIPIHEHLKQIGLIHYRDEIKSENHTRLFPELSQTEKVLKFGKQPGKQFKSVVTEALGADNKKSFHSLRHTFTQFYKKKGLINEAYLEVFGHEHTTLAARQYGGRLPSSILYEKIIAPLDFGLDLVAILKQSPHARP